LVGYYDRRTFRALFSILCQSPRLSPASRIISRKASLGQRASRSAIDSSSRISSGDTLKWKITLRVLSRRHLRVIKQKTATPERVSLCVLAYNRPVSQFSYLNYTQMCMILQLLLRQVSIPKLVGEFRKLGKGSLHPFWRPEIYSIPTPATINPLAMPDQFFIATNYTGSHFHLTDCLFGRIISPRNIRLPIKDAITSPILGQTHQQETQLVQRRVFRPIPPLAGLGNLTP
jgi:hypothetical protein